MDPELFRQTIHWPDWVAQGVRNCTNGQIEDLLYRRKTEDFVLATNHVPIRPMFRLDLLVGSELNCVDHECGVNIAVKEIEHVSHGRDRHAFGAL
jgi:hypothetical protein